MQTGLFVFVEVLLFLFPAILRRQSFYFICIILLGFGSFNVSCNQFDIPPPSLAFFFLFFWFLLPRGHKGKVFLEMYVLSLRYLLFVTDNNMIACTMPSRVKVLLENEDWGVSGTPWMPALEIVSFSVHSSKAPFLY